jgi:hypothetical protein
MYYDLDGNLIDDGAGDYSAAFAAPAAPAYNGYDDVTDMGEVARLQQIYNTRPDLQQQWADATEGRPWETHPFDGNPLQFIKWADEQERAQGVQGASADAGSPRDGIVQQIATNPFMQIAQAAADDQLGINDEATSARLGQARDLFGGRTALAGAGFRQAIGRAQDFYGAEQGRATADRTYLDALSGQRYDEVMRNATAGRVARMTDTELALAKRLGLISETDALETADAQRQADIARDRAASLYGVNGRRGVTDRSFATIAGDFARNQQIRRLQNQYGAFDPYFRATDNATEEYLGAVDGATAGKYGDFRTNYGDMSTRLGRLNQGAYEDVTGADRDLTKGYGAAFDDYSGANSDAWARFYAARSQIAGNLADSAKDTTDGWLDYQGSKVRTGLDAVSNQVNASNDYSTVLRNNYGASGDANSNAALGQGSVWSTAYGRVGAALGNAASKVKWGSGSGSGGGYSLNPIRNASETFYSF